MNPNHATPVRFATLDDLQAKLSWATSAPRDNAPISTLCVRPAEGDRQFVERIDFSVTEGVVGDRWIRKTWMRLPDGRPDPRIQVCLLGQRVLELVRIDPYRMPYPGDNIVADLDFSETNLPSGQLLRVGTATLEVSDIFNTACSKWRARYGDDALRWINLPDNLPHRLRGVLCRVVASGYATIKDRIVKV